MFGGFGSTYFSTYHKIIPKSRPVEEYDDRVELYTLYTLSLLKLISDTINSIILLCLVEGDIGVVRGLR